MSNSTFRMGWPAEIKIGVMYDGQSLVVKKALEEYNHRLSEVSHQNLKFVVSDVGF